jgi:hypothetical protein
MNTEDINLHSYILGHKESDFKHAIKMGEYKFALSMALDALKSCGEDENYDGDMYQYHDEEMVGDAITAIEEVLK